MVTAKLGGAAGDCYDCGGIALVKVLVVIAFIVMALVILALQW